MEIRLFNSLPKPYLAYAKILATLIKKPSGIAQLPQVSYVVEKLNIEREHLERYNDICGFTQQGILPPTYLAVLSQRLQMKMMTEEAFPFAIMGLVHVRNLVRQTRSIKVNELLKLSCSFGSLEPHEKGVQFNFITTASANGQEVWYGETTYLVRKKTAVGDKKAVSEKKAAIYQAQDINENWSVAANIGRRYALISGDFNPIHTSTPGAKLFGFSRAIAHGMWTKARCLAALGHLPEAYEAEVHFKLPVMLPASVNFKAQSTKDATFELVETGSEKPHIAGRFTTLA